MSATNKLYLISQSTDSKNGWFIYTNQLKGIFREVYDLIDFQVAPKSFSGKKKLVLRIAFQLFLLPSLWIDSLLNYKEIIRRVDSIKDPDTIALDHFQYWWLIFPVRKKFPSAKIILISHNLEFRNKLSYVKYAGFLYKIFAVVEFPVLLFWEWYCAGKADLITCINSNEQKFYSGKFLKKKTLLIYPEYEESISEVSKHEENSSKNYLLLLGSYGYIAKRLNALWIAKIFGRISGSFPGVSLYIAGRGGDKTLKQQIDNYNQVSFLGEVDDLQEVYGQAIAVIIPERMGGGFKLKIIEAIKFKKPMIIHEEALKGTGLEAGMDCLVFNDETTLKNSVSLLLNSKAKSSDLITNARNKAIKLYSNQKNITELKEILD